MLLWLRSRMLAHAGGGILNVSTGVFVSWAALAPSLTRLGHLVSERLRGQAVQQHGATVAEPAAVIQVGSGFHLALAQLACAEVGVPFVPVSADDPQSRVAEMRALWSHSVLLNDQDISAALVAPDGVVVASNEGTVAPEDQVLYGIGTSGSTGRPKLVLVERRHLNAYVAAMIDALNITSESCIAMVSGPTFDPSIGDIFTARAVGCRLVVADRLDVVGDPTRFLCAARPSHVVASPALWQHVDPTKLKEAYGTSTPLPLTVVLGGERMPAELKRKWIPAVQRFGNIFGVTECVGYQALAWLSEPVDPSMASVDIGAPIGRNRLVVLPPVDGDGVDTTAGDEGEGDLAVGGPQVARGYAGAPPFGEWHRTGDVAVPVTASSPANGGDENAGRVIGFKLVGRRDFQVKIDGRRIAIEEVELAMSEACVGVIAACVCVAIKRNNDESGVTSTRLIAAVQLANIPLSGEAGGSTRKVLRNVFNHIASVRLSPAQRPADWYLLGSDDSAGFPRTPNDKVDRKALAQLVEQSLSRRQENRDAEDSDDVGDAPPDGTFAAVQEAVAAIWRNLFNVSTLRGSTDFFASGGDSMLALRMCQLVGKVVRFPHLESDEPLSNASRNATAAPPATIPKSALEDSYGRVTGPLAPQHLMRYPTLAAYARHLACNGGEVVLDAEVVLAVPAVQKRKASAPPARPRKPEDELLLDCIRLRLTAVAAALITAGGVDVDSGSDRQSQQTSGLHIAAAAGDVETVRMLLQKGAKITAFDKHHVTPLHLAAQASVGVLKAFLEAGANMEVRDGRDQGVLHHAARVGNLDTVRFLCEEVGVRTLAPRDRWQRTPLHWAIVNGHLATVRYLVDRIQDALQREAGDGAPARKKCVSERLAKGKTHLVYESPRQLAVREHGESSEIAAACAILGDEG